MLGHRFLHRQALRGLLAACLWLAAGQPALAGADASMMQAQAAGAITGVASYRERIALPPGSVFEAVLEDVTLADAAATVIAKTVLQDPRPPIRFGIAFDPARILPANRYAVRARILVDGQLRFTSDRLHRVLTGGAGHAVDIPLRAVRGSSANAAARQEAADAPIPAHGLRLPASFRGVLPCADCPGVRHHLDLWPDQVFHLRREWIGKDRVRGDMGRWRVDPGRRALVLEGGSEAPLQFEIRGADRLRQLDLMGKPIVSKLPYELTSDGTLEPADVPLLMAGEMSYMADSARFTLCLTGRDYPIFPGDEALKLQRAYLAAVKEPGARLYVTFEGTVTRRPGMEGDRAAPAVTVERFVNVWPDQACSRAKAQASLFNTYWRIVRLDGEPLAPVPGRREPHLVLREAAQGASYAATVGCNRLIGPVDVDGDKLAFKRAAATMMACPPVLAELERKLGSALERARRVHLVAGTLIVESDAGGELMLLEAMYF